MLKDYFKARLEEAAEKGFEKSWATFEDDLAEGIEDAWYIQNILPQDYYEYAAATEDYHFWKSLEEVESE